MSEKSNNQFLAQTIQKNPDVPTIRRGLMASSDKVNESNLFF